MYPDFLWEWAFLTLYISYFYSVFTLKPSLWRFANPSSIERRYQFSALYQPVLSSYAKASEDSLLFYNEIFILKNCPAIRSLPSRKARISVVWSGKRDSNPQP